MTGKFRVSSCQPTGAPGRFLVTYAVKGKPDQATYTDFPVKFDSDITLLNGKVVMRGVE